MTESAMTMTGPAEPAGRSGRMWLWVGVLLLAIALPWFFYNWSTGRHSGFVLTMMSQMGMMVVFSLSYNMLLGQAGLLSFGHAVFFGLGGYSAIHFLNFAEAGQLPIPMELMPLLAGFAGLGFALVFGYMAAKQRATAFAMITMGIGELMATAAIMFHHFFGGEGGVSANRMIERSLFGIEYRAIDRRLLPDRCLDRDCRVWHALPDEDTAGCHGERHARQFRAGAIHGLRP